MKKHIAFKIFLTAIAAGMLLFALPFPAYAAGAGISCAGSVNEGDSLNVTVTFSGQNIAAVDAALSYDSSRLQFLSGGSGVHSPGAGKVKMVASQGDGMSSMSFSMVRMPGFTRQV